MRRHVQRHAWNESKKERDDIRCGNSFSLGRLFGIELRADFSWLIGLVLLIWLLSAHYFPMTSLARSSGAVFSAAITTALLFFASVLAHELGTQPGSRLAWDAGTKNHGCLSLAAGSVEPGTQTTPG